MDDDEVKEREKRIADLEKQRKKELENRRWMASCPDRKNSYGYTFERSECACLLDKTVFVQLFVHVSSYHVHLLFRGQREV